MMRAGSVLAVVIASAAAACKTSEDFPVVPGGPGSGTSGTRDAPGGEPEDALATIAGRVCVQTDLRSATGCEAAGVDGVRVDLGDRYAVAGPDGGFTIERPRELEVAWRVSGAGGEVGIVMTALAPLGGSALLRTVAVLDYEQLLLENGVPASPDFGSIVLRVTQAGAPKPAAAAATEPPAPFVLYDGASSLIWDTDATGASGVVWIPQAELGEVTVTITALGVPPTGVTVPVEGGAITYATVALP